MAGLIQVAGVIDAEEAGMLIECGVDMIGFPFRLDVHAEDLSEDAAAALIAAIGSRARPVLITYLAVADAVAALARALGVSDVQLHGDVPLNEVRNLRKTARGLRIIKSLVVRENGFDELIGVMRSFAPHVDGFITDTFDPETGACGATGRTHDWTISRALVLASPLPVMLAGGLTPTNVADAIATVRPAAVDAHTGLEGRDGRKDRRLVADFVAKARAAFGSSMFTQDEGELG